MKVFLQSNIQNITEQQLLQNLEQLPEWRRQKVLKYRFLIDRVQCTLAYLLLKQGLADTFNIQENVEFAYTKEGKPYLAEYPCVHFSLSHCKKGIVCAIGNKPIGCDIEEIPTQIDSGLLNYCFSDDEIKLIQESKKPCVQFTRLWTMKESFLKKKGEGLYDNMKKVLKEDSLTNTVFKTEIREELGFVYTVCY